MREDLDTLIQMERDAKELEKQGKLLEAKQLLQVVFAAHREDTSGKNKSLQVMTAGRLARVMANLYPTRDALPAPGTTEYKELNEHIKIIRQIVETSDHMEMQWFEDFVGDLDKFNRLVKTAADHKWDEAERIFKELHALREQDIGLLRVGADQVRQDVIKLGMSLQEEATFAPDDSTVIDKTRSLLEAGKKLVIIMDSKAPRNFNVYTVILKGDQEKSQVDKSGGCFIATAAYGSPFAPEVLVFRRFRDEVMLTSKFGTALVELYYFASPPLAWLISKAQFLRTATRRLLLEPILRLLKSTFRF